ncbi:MULTISPECIES: tetratricopeptide repeat protein [unclassified Pseudoalteromonas]|uniref:tetratricopeptide repeat protein n=1 Tax=unclassified Pseudoalteromonas TaxID=194690 RepID=UPI0016040828|nr:MULTISPECIES: tetratricopeptide repeat protein [unclassified Pseudoalteromonas]MBB1352323.1 sel1 repeat family protein [Pseudoalteromonas sp. SG45-3]MBB1360247.1 sel1 repeat family protein [Pseudoalteromonas sp. SG45-6]
MNSSTRKPRHLKLKSYELRKNKRFLRDSSLILPNGKKLHEVRSTTKNLNQFCLENFGQDEPPLIQKIKDEVIVRHNKAIEIGSKVQMMINSPLFESDSIHIQIGLLEKEKLLIPCMQQEFLDSIYELGLLYMEHGHLLGKGENDYYPLVKKAQKNGHSDAAYNLAVHHLKKSEWVEAEKQLYIGAKKESCLCLNKLAEMAEQGLTSLISRSDAARYYERAMRQGLPSAAVNLARLIFTGKDQMHSYSDAVDFLEEAAKDGDAKAMCQLGLIYEEGDYIKVNLNKSLHFYRLAADLGDANGQFFMGFIHRNLWKKFGVEYNPELGLELYEQAAAQGHEEAKENLYKAKFF